MRRSRREEARLRLLRRSARPPAVAHSGDGDGGSGAAGLRAGRDLDKRGVNTGRQRPHRDARLRSRKIEEILGAEGDAAAVAVSKHEGVSAQQLRAQETVIGGPGCKDSRPD